MKHITICQYSCANGVYRISLGNGVAKEFTNRKQVKKFFADCNRYLTLKLIQANTIYTTLCAHYRRNWFYFDNNKTAGYELYEADRMCKRNLEGIEKVFDIMVERSHYTNGNHFVFAHFKMIMRDMGQVITLLQVLMRAKSQAVDFYELQLLNLQVKKLEKEIYQFDGTLKDEDADIDDIIQRNQMKAIS